MSLVSGRVTRALGAAALVAGAVAGATFAGTAVPAPAVAEEVVHDHTAHFHADSMEAAANWSKAGATFTETAPAAANPCTGLGASDNLVNEVATIGPKWHLVVAVPRDIWTNTLYVNSGRDALIANAVSSVKSIESFYKARVGMGDIGQTPNQWTLRFDYGTTCGPQFPDISVYHLPRTQSQYTTTPFFGIVADLDASNLYERSNKRYLVHYVGASIYCGQSYIYAPTDNTGGAKYSITYNLHPLALTGGAGVPCDWTTDAHEIGHSMGAATGGPLNNDGAHTWDCWNDIMSYGGPVCGDGVLYFDWRENNYFNHPGSWNDTNLSAYWCKPTC